MSPFYFYFKVRHLFHLPAIHAHLADTGVFRHIWSPTGLKFTGHAIMIQIKYRLYRHWCGIHTKISSGQEMTRSASGSETNNT